VVAVGTVALAYLPHVIAVGPRVLGYLPGYLHEEGYAAGKRFLLLRALAIPDRWSAAVAAMMLASVALIAWRRVADPAAAGGVVLLAAFLLATPVQPWYGLSLAAVAVLAGRPEWLTAAAAGYPLYLSLFTGSPPAWWRSTSFALAAAVCAVAAFYRWAVQRGENATVSPPDFGEIQVGGGR
jgi:hypothetical protein